MAPRTIEYRIPQAPIGQPYYRLGKMYMPGEKVRIPEDEVPGGWVRDPDTKKCVPYVRSQKTGKITGRLNPAAWKRLTPGVKEQDEEKISELEKAKLELRAMQEALEEQQRRIDELGDDTEAEEEEDVDPDDGGDPDAPEPEDSEPAGKAKPAKGKKSPGKKSPPEKDEPEAGQPPTVARAADQDL
jgi:hypothetical protein